MTPLDVSTIPSLAVFVGTTKYKEATVRRAYAMLLEGLPTAHVARTLGVNWNVVKKWRRALFVVNDRNYASVKEAVIAEVRAGLLNRAQAARKYSVHAGTVTDWLREGRRESDFTPAVEVASGKMTLAYIGDNSRAELFLKALRDWLGERPDEMAKWRRALGGEAA